MKIIINKKQILILVTLVVLVLLLFLTDFILVKNNRNPIFCIAQSGLQDGGSVIYWGLGYKVINYGTSYDIGSWFLKYDSSKSYMNNLVPYSGNSLSPDTSGKVIITEH